MNKQERGIKMGGIGFAQQVTAVSPTEGYNFLVEEAIREYGDRPYNGTISTCQLGKCVKKYYGKVKDSIKEAYKIVEDMDYGEKWVAHYIDCGVGGCIEYTPVLSEVVDGRDAEGYTIVYNGKYIVGKYKSKTDALAAMKKFLSKLKTEKSIGVGNLSAERYEIRGIKNNRKVYQSTEWQEVRKSERELKSVKKQGNRIVQVHTYIFFGIASC